MKTKIHARRGPGPALCGAEYPGMRCEGPLLQTCTKCLAIQALAAEEMEKQVGSHIADCAFMLWATKAWSDAQFTDPRRQ